MKNYDLLVFIGRFQPLHLGHQKVIERALSLSKNVLILVGGEGKARTERNPFTYEERRWIIQEIYPNVIIRPLKDHTYNDAAWISEVQHTVKEVTLNVINGGGFGLNGLADAKVGLIGLNKDHTSFYLNLFPEWGSEAVEQAAPLAATNIRNMLYEGHDQRYAYFNTLHQVTINFLFNKWLPSENFARAKAEYEFNIEYLKKWGHGPHICADALVRVGGNILLVTRKDNGLLAMPGGHLNKWEKLKDASIRELREETKLRVPEPVLRGSIVASKFFDEPHRSQRGRVMTECFYIHLANETKLPEVRGSDDAAKAAWYPIGDLVEADFHEDHYHIIKLMLGLN